MTDEEFRIQCQSLTENQAKFVDTLYQMFELVEGLTEQMKGFRECLTALRDVLDSHHDTSKSLVDAHQTVLKAFAESSVELRENTEQVKRLVAKVDSYFGSAPGFDYDN